MVSAVRGSSCTNCKKKCLAYKNMSESLKEVKLTCSFKCGYE